jgi:hypothetical protein
MGKQKFHHGRSTVLAYHDIWRIEINKAIIEIERGTDCEGRIFVRSTSPIYHHGTQKMLLPDNEPLPGQTTLIPMPDLKPTGKTQP